MFFCPFLLKRVAVGLTNAIGSGYIMNELRLHRTLNILAGSPPMFARIHEKLKFFYGDTLRLRLLELIPVAVVRFTALLIYCIYMAYGFLPPVAKGKHFPDDPLDWGYVLYLVLMIAGLAIIAARERSFLKLRIHTERRGYVGALDAPSSIFLLMFLIGFVFYLFS